MRHRPSRTRRRCPRRIASFALTPSQLVFLLPINSCVSPPCTLCTTGPHHNLTAADPLGPRGLVVERAQAFGEDESGVVVSVEH
jgi:hypothetical protein